MFNLDFVKNAIRGEGGFDLSNETLDAFLASGSLVQIPAKSSIIEAGTIDKNIWITASGVTKAVYFDGKKECILGFSGPGTITISPLSYMLGKPAFCYFQTVTACDMIKITKPDFDRLMLASHEFCRWMVGILLSQFCALELKGEMLSESDIKANYEKMMKRKMMGIDSNGFDPNRPNLLAILSSKDVASYLGITQSYLSNLRKDMHKRK